MSKMGKMSNSTNLKYVALEVAAARISSFLSLVEQRKSLVHVNSAFRRGVANTDTITYDDGAPYPNECNSFTDEIIIRAAGELDPKCGKKIGHKIVLAQKDFSETAELADLGFGGSCRAVCVEFLDEYKVTIQLDPRFEIDFRDSTKKDTWPPRLVEISPPWHRYITMNSTLFHISNGSHSKGEMRFYETEIISDGYFPAGVEKGKVGEVFYCERSFIDSRREVPFNMAYCTLEVPGKSIDEVYHDYLERDGPQGTIQDQKFVGDTLTAKINNLIDNKIASEDTPDYHPYSNDTVRDIVHPAIYAYEEDVSPMIVSFKAPKDSQGNNVARDRWQRPYEASKYQWLPTYFKVSQEGKCKIDGYINGLDKTNDSELYSAIELLFERFLPRFEYVFSYVQSNDFYLLGDVDENDHYEAYMRVTNYKEPKRAAGREILCGRELQVITKIVDYELKPGQSYEGVWHVEGMSHENIVATGLWVAKRDAHIDGGEILFKRAPTMSEVKHFGEVEWNNETVKRMVEENYTVPLGKIETKDGQALVFPNCHIHKVKKMTNLSDTETAIRRIVVFFLIDPERRVISTREVPDQRESLSLKDAKARRLKLMNDRKYHKQTWNLRDIGLCEH